MEKQNINMIDLEQELVSASDKAFTEEQNYAEYNFSLLDKEYDETEKKLPYPNRKKHDYETDYDDIAKIQYEKKENKPFWTKMEEINEYKNSKSLYFGHLFIDNSHYYFLKDDLPSRDLSNNGTSIHLINPNDKNYKQRHDWWINPLGNKSVMFASEFTLSNRTVEDFNVKIDRRRNDLIGKLSNAYLIRALVRNKDKVGIEGIIETIQEKQNYIRTMDENQSFIVQGCAGSGKTMVLLHRLNYLLYNKSIANDEYALLVPNVDFKQFIGKVSSRFKINRNRIFSYQEYYQNYYQSYIDKEAMKFEADYDELAFPYKFLEKAYSKKLIQDAYRKIFDYVSKQVDTLVLLCESKLSFMVKYEELSLADEINNTKKIALSTTQEKIKKILSYLNTKTNTYDNLPILILEIEEKYSKQKAKYLLATDPNIDVAIDPNDNRLNNDKRLLELKKSIDQETKAVKKAFSFTIDSHKNKLKILQSKYNVILEEVILELMAQEKAKYLEKATELQYVYDNVTLEETAEILQSLKEIWSESNNKISELESALKNPSDYLGKKFEKEISAINNLINISIEIINDNGGYIKNLLPAYNLFNNVINLGKSTQKLFENYPSEMSSQEEEKLKSQLLLFSNRINFYQRLFNLCSKQILEEFNIKLCSKYKHYWYLSLYCHYLTKPLKATGIKYLFIDEAQDLSQSEIELIKKLNTNQDNPDVYLNLFGDTNQMVTLHGIKDWQEIDIIPTIHILDENFRNTNQVIDYCCEKLNINMKTIGVDLDPVNEYESLSDVLKLANTFSRDSVFIVKNEYYKKDLQQLLLSYKIEGCENIYTVKTVKGLEFKEVFVFDSGMTESEKYISYTRSLTKLNVIKTLPAITNRKEKLFIQGSDILEEDE